MRKRIFILLCLCLPVLMFNPQVRSQTTSELLRVRVKGKWGFISRSGEVLIKPQFHFARAFSEGLACIAIDSHRPGKYGFIDTTGKVVITPQFYVAGDFSNGLAVFVPKEIAETGSRVRYGFFDKTGKVVIEPKLDFASSFSEGLAVIGVLKIPRPIPKEPIDNIKKYGFIDMTGRMVIPARFDFVYPFSEG